MKTIEKKLLFLRIIREWSTYVLLIWNMMLWFLMILFIPSYWAQSLALCLVSYLVTLGILIYTQSRHAFKSSTNDRFFSPAFKIADETLPLLRTGLNEVTAKKVAEIIRKISDVSAVAITDREKVLAFIGTGCEKHPPGMPIVTQATIDVINTGVLWVGNNKSSFNCKIKDCYCPLESAVIAPLTLRKQVAGTVKLYQTQKGQIPDSVIKLAKGTAQLLSMQIELSEMDHQAQLMTEARLDALQAQINPHFLFNTLNTIGMLIRTNPHTARKLLYRFSSFFRYSLRQNGRFITVKEELEYVRNYLVLEKARFREKLVIVRKIDKSLMEYKIPILSIQPLVENAIRHGITPKEGKGTVQLIVRAGNQGEIEIIVNDDGVGILPEIMPRVMEPGFGSGSGVGLSNVNERLKMIYGDKYGLQLWSEPESGTTVKIIVPERSEEN